MGEDVVHSPHRTATLAALPVSVLLVGTSGNPVTPIVPHEYIALLILPLTAGAAIGRVPCGDQPRSGARRHAPPCVICVTPCVRELMPRSARLLYVHLTVPTGLRMRKSR